MKISADKISLDEAQRRNSVFFLDEKKAVDFFLENGRYKDNEQISKKKKNRSSGENGIFAQFPIFLILKMGNLRIMGKFIP